MIASVKIQFACHKCSVRRSRSWR